MYFMSDIQVGVAFYNQNFATRPLQLISGGHKALIKFNEKQFADENGFVDPDIGRHIMSEITSTSGDDLKKTEMIFLWGSEIYEKVSVVSTGRYLEIAKVVATFILASERILAIYLRVKKSK